MPAMNPMTKEPATEEDDRLIIPLDLTEWAAQDVLFKWLNEKIESLNWSNSELADYLARHPQYRPKELLTVLCLAYATGVYASDDIEAKCYRDEPFRSLVGQDIPTIPQIRRFRRENRGLLKWLMTELLRQALKEKYSLGEQLLPPGLRRYLQEVAGERLDLARHMDRANSEF